ncbi:MAG TPA: amidohydrolase family protein [Candidatus Binatia bacterium]|nr:amidohydrolase family protein [Candidatus Binatia bacterium]
MKADLVIRGGTVVDGSGNAPFTADVVVASDRIASIGRWDGPAAEVVDARGKLVTPGFVDVHTHLDAQITWDPLGSPSNLHGVTSAVVGNCGVGFAPCRPADRDYLMFLMEGVEDIPRAAMKEGIAWGWESFPEYLAHLSRLPLGINVGAHLSHAPLRIWAMGELGATDAAATDDELALMHRAVVDAMRAGALGFATGRTTMHRTPSWDPVPGTFADRRELDAVASGLSEYGTGVFEVVPYGAAGEAAHGFDVDYEWMVPLALATARPISFGMIQNLAYPEVWKDILAKVEAAAKRGARLVPQVAVRSVGILMGIGTGVPALTLFPAGFELVQKPLDEQRAALRDPALRAKLVESMRGTSGDILGGMATLRHVFPLEDRGVRAYELRPEESVVALAERTGREVGQVILDHLVATEGRGFFIVPLFNPDIDAAGAMLEHPLTGIGLGDSGAHTSQTSDASYATFALAYWVRERGLLPIERMVRKLTFDPALVWGLGGRGLLRAGFFADVNVIDFDRLDVELPELRHEFPAGAPHFSQAARGYCATIVNGKVLMRDGAHTGALPGRLLKNELCAS